MPPTGPFHVNRDQARQRVGHIWPILKKRYPDARIALEFKDPLQLLVATILSAQCTDARVNAVTRDLFRKYRKADDYLKVTSEELQQDIKSTGFYKNKAAHIQGACRTMMHDFKGKVPNTMEALLALPGVGRKTANCVLGDAFDIPGITCDTHVIRLARRLGLSENRDPVKLEFDLADIVPKRNWTQFSHLMITHGRQICKARKPNCPECPLAGHCPALAYPELM